MDATKAINYATGLRLLASLIEEHPEAIPNSLWIDCLSYYHTGIGEDAEEGTIPEALATLMRAGLRAGATVEKEYIDDRFRLNIKLNGDEIVYKVSAPRNEVCTMKVVGTEIVEKKMPPKGEWTTEMVEQDKVEWECHPLLNTGPIREVK